MVFKCQENSFLKEYSSTVVSCEKSKLKVNLDGKEMLVDGYEIIFKDTILFPEGGGQPSDCGTLNGFKVLDVKRRGNIVVHFLDTPFNTGETVKQIIDWDKRFDHMQQHSGQHLISAIFEKEYGFATTSWWLGDQVSYIELDCSILTNDQQNANEKMCNELIRSSTNVSVKVYESAKNLPEVHSRGLPKDHEGDVRVITIEGVDSNMCCGTHVTNLSQLQVIKLLGTEKSKRKNKTLLYFLVGNRVLNRLDTCLNREQQLTILLKNNPSEHVQLVDKLQKNFKTANKDLKSVLKDLANFEIEKLKCISPPPKYYFLHHKEAESDFINTFIKGVGIIETLCFLSVGGDKGAGSIAFFGKEADVAELGPRVAEILNGKGALKGRCYQAKVLNIENRQKVEELLRNYFKQT